MLAMIAAGFQNDVFSLIIPAIEWNSIKGIAGIKLQSRYKIKLKTKLSNFIPALKLQFDYRNQTLL